MVSEKNQTLSTDNGVYNTIDANLKNYYSNYCKGKDNYKEYELERRRIEHIRKKNLFKTEQLLIEFETNFQSKGGKVFWACDSADVINTIDSIIKENEIERVFKTKSSIVEETNLVEHLRHKSIEVVQTDFGGFVSDESKKKSHHLVFPLIDRTKNEINEVLSENHKLKSNLTEYQLSDFTDRKIYETFMESGNAACITGANFLIADKGVVAFTENEGNILKCLTYSKVHIVVVGFDKIMASTADLFPVLSMLSVHATGQALTCFNTMIDGSKGNDESPEKTYVIIVDNGRTEILKRKRQRDALTCIHCGACANVCPVYKNSESAISNSVCRSPISLVTIPLMRGLQKHGNLVSACTLCGKCVDVCPVRIDIPKMILASRREMAEDGLCSSKEKSVEKNLVKYFASRKKLDSNRTIKNWHYKGAFVKNWGTHRELPKLAPKSFSQIWSQANPKTENDEGKLF